MASIFLSSREDVEDICSKEELVTFRDVSCQYSPGQSVTVKYHLGSRVQTSASDWLGIFPSQWEDLSQPLARISSLPALARAGGNSGKGRCKSVSFSAANIKSLESKDCSYQFVYVDVNNQVLGVSLPFKVKGTSDEGDCGADSGSESPVLLSSGSESEGEWEMANQSSTLRQVATGNASGGSSTSDLSDIVVLSSSPSQEAARQQEDEQLGRVGDVLSDISWNSDSDDGEEIGVESKLEEQGLKIIELSVDDRLQEKGPKIIELPSCPNKPIKNVRDNAFVNTIKSAKIIEVPMEERKTERKAQDSTNKNNTKCAKNGNVKANAQKVTHKEAEEVSIFSGKGKKPAPKENQKTCLPSANTVTPQPLGWGSNAWQKRPVLNKLKIVELDDSLDKEDHVEVETGEKGAEQQHRLITEIVKRDTKTSNAKLQESAKKKVVEVPPTTKVAVSVVTASLVQSTKVDTELTTITTPCAKTIMASGTSTQSKKMKKKRKKDKKREQCKDHSDDDDDDIPNDQPAKVQHKRAKKPTTGISDQCSTDEIPPKTPMDTLEQTGPGLNKLGLVFDELSELDVRQQREKVKQARRHERKAARSKGTRSAKLWELMCEGELYGAVVDDGEEEDASKDRASVGSKQRKQSPNPKCEKKGKNKAIKAVLDTNIDVNFSGIAERTESDTSSKHDTKPPKPARSPRKDAADRLTKRSADTSLPGAEMRDLKQKYLVKASRKVKRSSSSRRRTRLGSEFQYLFSMDLKSTTSKDEKSSTLDTEEYHGPSLPIITIQDTSAEDFPALPSQQGTAATQPINLAAAFQSGSQHKADHEDDKKTGDEDDEADEDGEVDTALDCVFSGGPLVPYVPPYVLDVMDALPPASASVDGRSLVEWRRAMLPLLPKHALPVFHSKYKTKFARKHELRRMKLRRGGQGRHGAIIDRIRHQLAVPASLERIAKKMSKPVSPNKPSKLSVAKKPLELPGWSDAPLSYANIVKQNQVSQGASDQCAVEIPVADEACASSGCIDQPCLALVPLVPAEAFAAQASAVSKPSEKMEVAKTGFSLIPVAKKSSKGRGKISSNFPKEFTNYTSSPVKPTRNLDEVCSDLSQLQVVPFRPNANKQNKEAIETAPAQCWPLAAIFGTCSNEAPERCDAPRVHARRVISKAHHQMALASSPPRRPRVSMQLVQKDKTSALLALPAPEQAERGEQGALLDLALTSSIADNANMRTTLVSLERQVQSLKKENEQLKKEREHQPMDHENTQQPQTSSPKPRKAVKDPEDRKVPICKWAGKVSKLVRSNVEVISLSAKLRDNEQEIASLTNQVNSLKEALQAETKRTTRALTKWFKLKLKVKVLRSKLRDTKHDSGSSTLEEKEANKSSARVPLLCSSILTNVADPEEQSDTDEPPCKRQKLDTKDGSHTQTFSFPLPPPFVSRASPSLLPSPPPPRPQCPLPPTPPSYASPPAAALFSLFPGHNTQTHREQPHQGPWPQQAVVAPLSQFPYNGLEVAHLPQQQQAMFHQPNFVNTAPLYSHPQSQPFTHQPNPQPNQIGGQGFRRRGQRKRSPPHLPLPTPRQSPVSPPFHGFQVLGFPHHMANAHASPPRHRPFQRSPSARKHIHPISKVPPHQHHTQLAWPLPSNVLAVDPSQSHAPTPFEQSANIPLWNPASPPSSSWAHSPPEFPPEFVSYAQNNASQWVNSPRQAWVENPGMYPAHFDNTRHQQPHHENERRVNKTCKGGRQWQAESIVPAPLMAAPPAHQPPSPPGRYRSDFLRRMMRGDAVQPRGQPNPYRLFHQMDAPPTRDTYPAHPARFSPPFPSLPYSYDQTTSSPTGATAGTSLPSSHLLSLDGSSEATYRNTPAFVELTADGLVEGTRQEMLTASLYGITRDGNNSNSNNDSTSQSFLFSSRPIESSKASPLADN